ncbi:MAG: hypothetical protein IJN90_04645 [Bacilli bacterium]|nr:hypothetical protein [Bacilli bacterium]
MSSIDKELNAIRIFREHIKNNIFYTNLNYKIESEVKISAVFPIYLRNPNEYEIEYFRNVSYEKIFSILSFLPNLEKILYSDDFTINDAYTAFSFQIYQIKEIYDEYLKVNNSEIIDIAIKNNDIKSFSLYLSLFINENIVLLEVKEWDKIDSAIIAYSGCAVDDVIDCEYRQYFIHKYLNLFNIVNFDLTVYKGIELLDEESLFFPITSHNEYNVILRNVLGNPYYIDRFILNDNDILYLFFLINNFDDKSYMRERKYSVDFISCLEFFLVKKLNDNNSKIENQIRHKVRKCCKEVGYNISNNEIKDLYDYRCFVVHGNFEGLNRKVNKIINRTWYKKHLNKLYSSEENIVRDNIEKEELIYCRLYEIFNIVFKLYCEKKNKLEKLKEITNSEQIEKFKF